MSTHYKHNQTKAPMSRYCEHTHRTALVCASDVDKDRIKDIAHMAKELVNTKIQELSLMIPERLFAYATIDVIYSANSIRDNGELRFVIRDAGCESSQDCLDNEVQIINDAPYLIEILVAPEHRLLTRGSREYFDVRIAADIDAVISSLCDTILDSIMFSSYPGLRALSIEEKRDFSKNKWDFYQKHNLRSFYDIRYFQDIHYYSLAYSARTGYTTIHLDQYIQLWKDFLTEYYPTLQQFVPSVKKQLKLHVDSGHLPKDKIAEEISHDNYSERAYLLLTINKRISSKSREEIRSVFGLKEISGGHFALVPLKDFNHYKPYFFREELTVFKVVKPFD